MTPTANTKNYQKDIRGQRFTQSALPLDLVQAIAGQRSWSKGSAAVLLSLVCLLAAFLVAVLGTDIGIDSVFNPAATNPQAACADPTQSRFTLMVMIIWAVVLLRQTISRSVAALAIALSLGTAIYGLLISTDILPPPEGNLFFVVISVLIVWGLIFLTHILFRFAIAALDVLFSSARLAKGLLIGFTTLSVVGGTIISMTPSGTELECSYAAIPLWARGAAIATGLIWGLGLALAAWWINDRRQVPWRSPDVFREWALAIGSWAGTSFHGLDLSYVNFQGSCLANSDLRGDRLYHTCFQQASGLERARVDRRYLDLDIPNVQTLLTHACSHDPNFVGVRLQGAYLQGADMRGFNLTDTTLMDADLQNADLREACLVRSELAGATLIHADLRRADLTDANLTGADLSETDLRQVSFVRAQVARANLSGADLTGICIEDWSVSSQTQFTNVHCHYIYRKWRDGQPCDRYPIGRDFEAGEFAALFQKPENELEVIFKGEFSYNALSLAFYKLQTQEPELQLKLNGIEQRGDLWVVKVISLNPEVELTLEQRLSELHQSSEQEQQLDALIKASLYRDYEETRQRLLESEQLVKQLAGISQHQASALEELSKKSFGNSFFITGSTITNLTGSGNIEYIDAARQVRQIVSHGGDRKQVAPLVKQFVQLLKQEDVAKTGEEQLELMQQLMVAEAETDPEFRAYLLQESQTMMRAMAGTPLVNVIQGVISQLNAHTK